MPTTKGYERELKVVTEIVKIKAKLISLLVIILLGYGIGISACSESGLEEEITPKPEQEPLLELVSWYWYREHGYIIASGEVRNISDDELDNVLVKVRYYTADMDSVKSDLDVIERDPLMSGEVSAFEVYTVDDPRIEKSRLSFQYPLGKRIATVYTQQ